MKDPTKTPFSLFVLPDVLPPVKDGRPGVQFCCPCGWAGTVRLNLAVWEAEPMWQDGLTRKAVKPVLADDVTAPALVS